MKMLMMALAIVAFAVAPALANQCPLLIKQIQDATAGKTDEASKKAQALAKEAQALHAAGKHADPEHRHLVPMAILPWRFGRDLACGGFDGGQRLRQPAQRLEAERGFVDALILPRETRPQLVRALRQLRSKRKSTPPKKHGNIPL